MDEEAFEKWFMERNGINEEQMLGHPAYSLAKSAWSEAFSRGWNKGEVAGYGDGNRDGYAEGNQDENW